MGLNLSTEELAAETTPSQRKAIARLTGFGEFKVLSAELWVRGVVWVMIGSTPQTAKQFAISVRGKVDPL